MAREAGKHRRLPWYWMIFYYLPDATPPWKRPWAGVCLFERSAG